MSITKPTFRPDPPKALPKISLGLAPDLAEKDDFVCILYGCSIPVVLRKFTKSCNILESGKKQRKTRRKNESATNIAT